MSVIKYELIVYFNEYAGNFHREFNAHVFAYDSQTHDWITTLAEGARKDLGEENIDTWHDYLELIFDEYGSNISSLTNYQKGEGTTAITVHFLKNPTPILPTLLERIQTFPKVLANCWEFSAKNIEIKKVELVRCDISDSILAVWQSTNASVLKTVA